MYTKWTAHLKDAKEKQEFERTIHSAKSVLDRLSQLIAEEEDNLNQFDRSSRAFEKPNWAYLQAYRNGERALLEYMKKLVNLDQQEKPDHGRQSINGRSSTGN